MSEVLISGLVVFITHTIEAVTGFGCSVLAMPFVTALLGMRVGIMVITILAWFLALYFVIRKWKEIDWRQFSIIIGCMLIGLPIGMYIFRHADVFALRSILAIFICIVSAWQLALRLMHRNHTTTHPGTISIAKTLPYYLLLITGGIVHGIFSTGGPLVVLYATKFITDKGRFRATLCLLWTTLNTIIIGTYLIEGSMTTEVVKNTGILIPFVIMGIFAGEKIHAKVNERIFSLIVFALLLATGIIMLWN